MQRVKPQYYVTVDAVVFTVMEKDLKILLIERMNDPFAHMYALPGGFVEEKENLQEAVTRELREETNVGNIYLEQVGSFGEVQRDPRGRTITVAYMALIDADQVQLQAKTDAESARWYSVKELPKLAFDHGTIVETALQHLRKKIINTNIAFQLLPKEFTLTELQQVHEVVLNTSLDKRNFRKKLFADDLVVETQKTKREGAHRPARLYRFKQ